MAKTEDGWELVSEEMPTRVQFENIGDEFIGTFRKIETIDASSGSFRQYIFDVVTLNGEEQNPDERFAVSAGSRIRAGMQKARPGNKVRIRFTAEVDTGQDSPMKEYEISIQRR